MNRNLLSLFSAIAICASVFLTSCGGDDPEPTPDRNKFTAGSLQAWTCAENSTVNSSSTFTIHVKNDPNSEAGVLIENFYAAGFPNSAFASVSGNTFSASNQAFAGFNIVSLSANSTGANSFSMNYIIQNGSVYDTCSANCTK